VIGIERALLSQKIAVVAGRFVAVMAVGDEEGLGIDDGRDVADCLDVGHRPHAVDDAQMIRRGVRCLPGDGFFEQVLRGVFGVGIEAEKSG